MSNQITNLMKLPTDIQIKVIRTLFTYAVCHIEGNTITGKMEVVTSCVICAKYPDGYYYGDTFTQEGLGIDYIANKVGNRLWENMTGAWEFLTNDEKDILIESQGIILESYAKKVLKNINIQYQREIKEGE